MRLRPFRTISALELLQAIHILLMQLAHQVLVFPPTLELLLLALDLLQALDLEAMHLLILEQPLERGVKVFSP